MVRFVSRLLRALLKLLIIIIALSVVMVVTVVFLLHKGILDDPVGDLRRIVALTPQALGALGLVWFVMTVLEGDPPSEGDDRPSKGM